MSKELFSKEKIKNLINEVNKSIEIVNINKFSNDVSIDLLIENFTHKSKAEARNNITEVLSKNFDSSLNFKINFKPKVVEKEDSNNKLNNIKNIIAISSAKGGVGKSTVTANIAVTLSKMGFKVGILDADIYGPSMHIMFDLVGRKPLAVDVDGKSKMKPLESYGVKILSIGFFTSMDQAVIWRGPMATKALNQLIFDADWKELDFLLIDLPPGTGDIHLSIVQKLSVNGSIVVSTPQIVAMADARKGISMYRQENINIPVLGLIENMSYFNPPEDKEKKYYIFGKDGVKNLAEDFEIPFIGEVPIVQGLRESGDIGRPGALQEDSDLSKIFDDITKNMIINLTERNTKLPPTEIVKIKTMAGCS
jgi:ATP-binding protein involved in chromosome partitioning|tara:strand:+ start:6847 stop:7941 length:1095 start_codon:yes stop_codon:yes gene_type:complete